MTLKTIVFQIKKNDFFFKCLKILDYDLNGFDTTFSKKLIDFFILSLTAFLLCLFSRMKLYCTMTRFHCLFMEE